MENKNNQEENSMSIELNENIAEGLYSNMAVITHSTSEFVIDFVNIMPGVPKAKVKSRIVMSAQNAKRLMKALKDNISKYEAINGNIKDIEDPIHLPMQFGGQSGTA